MPKSRHGPTHANLPGDYPLRQDSRLIGRISPSMSGGSAFQKIGAIPSVSARAFPLSTVYLLLVGLASLGPPYYLHRLSLCQPAATMK